MIEKGDAISAVLQAIIDCERSGAADPEQASHVYHAIFDAISAMPDLEIDGVRRCYDCNCWHAGNCTLRGIGTSRHNFCSYFRPRKYDWGTGKCK